MTQQMSSYPLDQAASVTDFSPRSSVRQSHRPSRPSFHLLIMTEELVLKQHYRFYTVNQYDTVNLFQLMRHTQEL